MPTYTMKGPDGRVYQLNAGDDVPREKVEAELRRRIAAQLGLEPSAAPDALELLQSRGTLPAPTAAPEAPKDEGFLTELGKSLQRGVGSAISAPATVLEKLPEILGATALTAYSPTLAAASPTARRFAELAGRAAVGGEGYDETVKGAVEAIRGTGEGIREAAGPVAYGSPTEEFERNGLLAALRSASLMGAESLPVLGATLATGALTRSPTAAGAVMAAGFGPQEFEGILERQERTGKGGVSEALAGAVAVTALDTLTGLGGKALSSVGRKMFTDTVEAGLLAGAKRVAATGAKEAGTEAVQTIISQVAGGESPATKEALREVLDAGIVGLVTGSTVAAPIEAVSALRRGKAEAEAEPETKVADSPEVEQEYLRLVATEVQAVRDQNPGMTQRQAYDRVIKNAGQIYDTAITNILTGGEVDAGTDTGAAVDVVEGAGAGAAPDRVPVSTAPSTEELGEVVGGGLGVPAPSVSAPEAGAGAGVSALAPEATQFDPITLPIYEAPNMAARKAAAKPIINDIIDANLGDIAVPAKVTNQIATQMAQRAARKEVFNPTELTMSVLADNGIVAAPEVAAPEVAMPVSTAPAAPAVPSVDEVAVAPVKAAIEAATAPTPPTPGVVPTIAQATAREVGITPTPPVTPPVAPEMAAPEVVAPPAPPATRTMNDMAGIGTVNPENTNEVLVEGGGVQLTPVGEDIVQLDSLRAVEKGGGRRAMEQLTKVADENGTTIQLSPEPFAAPAGKEMTPTELSDWYAGFGFEAQPDGTMVRSAATLPSADITPAPTPQQVVEQIDQFARSEAEDRGFDPDMFAEGARDAARGAEPLPDNVILEDQGADALDAYKAGVQFGRDRVTDIQAAPPPEAAAPPGAPPTPPTPPTATGGPGGPAPKKPKVVSNGKPVVLTEAQKRTALAKAKAQREKMNRIQKRIAATNDTADVLSGGIELVKLVRGDKENWALLRGAFDTLNVGKWKAILPTLSTEDIFRILKDRIPGLTEADRIIRQEVARFQTKQYFQLSEELEQVAAFLKKYPKAAQALSDLEFATVAYQVDPTKAATAEEYFAKVDEKAKELRAQLKTTKDPKKQSRLETKLKNRFGEIESVYKGVPGDERVVGWRDLARPEFGANKGKEIFKLIRDAHRRDLEAKYNALRSRLMETKKDEALDEALEKLEEAFKPALDQVIYFPAMRFGSFYARVGKGANSIFKMFETETERNKFMRVMEVRGEEITDFGNVEDLRNNFQQVTGGPLKEVLDLFDDNPKDIGALKSQVFDLWLQTMSQGDMRKHMAPRKARAGYSTDILKNFANFRRSSINDIKRAQYGYKLRTEISRAKDLIADQPDRAKLAEFIKEVELRTLSDLMPPDRSNAVWEGAIQLGNKLAFYQYLANPKTAVIQLTQLHIVALPMLAQKYGSAKATAALAKYGFSSLGGFVSSPLKSVKKEDGSYSFDWEQPNLLDNPISALKQESDPELYEVLSEGWQEGRDLNLYMDTFANQIGGYGAADPQQRSALQELMRGRVDRASLRGAVFAFEAMGSLMHQMERVNREATYMAALELAYRENRKKNQSHAEAKKNAIESAVDTTLEATFDFSSYNKPRVLTSGLGRLAGQFMSYPYMMTSLLTRNMYTALKVGQLEPGERMAAAQIATGALVNIGLYAGLTGLPLYGLFKVIGSMLAWLFDDEDEEGGLSYVDENGNLKATYNIDWWFRNVWIPKFFGPDGTVANLFGLDDDTAATLALAAEKGPISAITDIDLANSVALDFLFFVPREPRAETVEGQLVEYTFAGLTGAFGNTVMDYIKAGKDLMNGYEGRALERMPKLFGNMAKANRFAEEGQLNYNRELVGMDADFWTSDKAILQALGFSSTEADQRQQQNYEAKSIRVEVEKAREDVLTKFRKVALDAYQYGPTPEVLEERQKVMEDWLEFNQRYPTDVIGMDTLYEVQTNAVDKALKSKATRGVPFDMEKTPYLRGVLRERVEAEER